MDSVVPLSKPGDKGCGATSGKDAPSTNSSLFGFSISIDESQNSLWIGAPNCDQVYKCHKFENCKEMQKSIIDPQTQLGNNDS